VGANNIFSGSIQGANARTAGIMTAHGLFRIAQPTGRPLRDGATATFIVGADRVRIAHGAEDSRNRLDATITAIELVGSVATLFLDHAGGAELRVQKPESELEGVAPGARVAVTWDEDDAFVLPDPA
jgi:spermidine/putrescine transport system ATP-binding protein